MSFFDSAPFKFGFQTHHLVPQEMFEVFEALFMRTGFDLEMTGNKIALVTNGELAAIFASASDDFKATLKANGWGLTPHFGNHPGYNAFISSKLSDIDGNSYSDVSAEKRALFDLIRFARDVSTGNFEGLNIQSDAAALNATYTSLNFNPELTQGDAFADIESFISDFSVGLVDAGEQSQVLNLSIRVGEIWPKQKELRQIHHFKFALMETQGALAGDQL